MKDGWGMSAEDHEVEQDNHLRQLSKAKQGELLAALHCVSKRIHVQRRVLIATLVASILGLIATLYLVFMVYGQ